MKKSLEALKKNLGDLSSNLQGKKLGGEPPTEASQSATNSIKNSNDLVKLAQSSDITLEKFTNVLNSADISLKTGLTVNTGEAPKLSDVLVQFFKHKKYSPSDIAQHLNDILPTYPQLAQDKLIESQLTKEQLAKFKLTQETTVYGPNPNSLGLILTQISNNNIVPLNELHKLLNNLKEEYITYLNKPENPDPDWIEYSPSRVTDLVLHQYITQPNNNLMMHLHTFLIEINTSMYPLFKTRKIITILINRALKTKSTVQDKIKFFKTIISPKQKLSIPEEDLFSLLKTAIRNFSVTDAISFLNGIHLELKTMIGENKDATMLNNRSPKDVITLLNGIHDNYHTYLKDNNNQWIKDIIDPFLQMQTLQDSHIQQLSNTYGAELKQEITQILETQAQAKKQKEDNQTNEEQRQAEERERHRKEQKDKEMQERIQREQQERTENTQNRLKNKKESKKKKNEKKHKKRMSTIQNLSICKRTCKNFIEKNMKVLPKGTLQN